MPKQWILKRGMDLERHRVPLRKVFWCPCCWEVAFPSTSLPSSHMVNYQQVPHMGHRADFRFWNASSDEYSVLQKQKTFFFPFSFSSFLFLFLFLLSFFFSFLYIFFFFFFVQREELYLQITVLKAKLSSTQHGLGETWIFGSKSPGNFERKLDQWLLVTCIILY